MGDFQSMAVLGPVVFFSGGRHSTLMTRLRIGYDLSFLAPVLSKVDGITGVGRVIRNLLDELLKRDDVDMRAVGSFAGDWNYISTSVRVEKWVASHGGGDTLKSLPGVKSRFGLGRPMSRWILGLEGRTSGAESNGQRCDCRNGPLLRILRRIASFDSRPHLASQEMDVFHATFMPPPGKPLEASIPRVVSIHDVIPGRFPDECGTHACGLFERTIASLNPVRDVVVTNSLFTRSDFCAFTAFPADRTIAAPLAVGAQFRPVMDATAIQALRDRLGLGDRPYFLNVANPQPRKNLPHLVLSFYQFLEGAPDWNGALVLAGSSNAGWGSETLDQAIHSVPKFAARVLRIGAVREDDLPTLYSGAMAFLFPSLYEGFGLPVLESMACGTPVVASTVSSLPEVCGDAALLVAPNDVQALAAAMQKLVYDEPCRLGLRAKGLEQVRRFSWSKTADLVASAYRLAHQTRNVNS